jgi:hypothetical protein
MFAYFIILLGEHICMCGCVVSYTYMSDNFIVQEIQIEVRVVHAIRIMRNIRLDVVL